MDVNLPNIKCPEQSRYWDDIPRSSCDDAYRPPGE